MIRAPAPFLFATVLAFAMPALCPAVTFSNTNYIVINDSTNPPTLATPWPSLNYVSLEGQAVTKVTVTLHGLSHQFPEDIDMLLIGPQGQEAILMSNAGGPTRLSVTNLTITLDDDAPGPLPVDTGMPLVSGTFKPTERQHPLAFDFPAPVPAGNSNAPSVLSVFNGTDPFGTWNLYVVDDTAADSGSISGGWSLDIATAPVQLEIQLADSSHVVISWPSAAAHGVLESATSLAGPVTWEAVTNSQPFLVSGRLTTTNLIGPGTLYYRLAH